jgi:hypothetical protein
LGQIGKPTSEIQQFQKRRRTGISTARDLSREETRKPLFQSKKFGFREITTRYKKKKFTNKLYSILDFGEVNDIYNIFFLQITRTERIEEKDRVEPPGSRVISVGDFIKAREAKAG